MTMKTIYADSKEKWRLWLDKNHSAVKEIWLVFYKKHTGRKSISYDASVEEALCFGWIDSIIKRIDEDKYARKFTPRNDGSVWSEVNKGRAEKMIKAGRMTPIGMKKIEAARESGRWEEADRKDLDFFIPPELQEALKKNPAAKANFEKLPPSYRKRYLGWINSAKRPDTRTKRIKEAIRTLSKDEKLGMK